MLNQGIDQVVAVLRSMEKFPFADKESLHSAQDEMEEVRASMNADFTEQLGDRERFDQGRFWKQGLPPRVGIVPHPLSPKKNNAGKPAKSTRE